jgi:hypothetical protein
MKTIYFKLSLLMVAFFMLINYSLYSQTIYSTTGGGPWDSTWTWVSGIVPSTAYDVVINGPVYSSTNGCHNLTVNSGGTLYNNYYNYTLTVTGDVVNNGSISNHVNYLYLDVAGDVTNNGTWNNTYTSLTGTADHIISCQNNHNFSGYQFQNTGTGNMFINTEAYFQNVRVHMNNLDLTLAANATLKMHGGYLYMCNVIGAGSTSLVYGADSPYYQNVSFTDLSFEGTNDINNICSTHGTVINNGFLQNDYYSFTLSIYDEFINNGTIQNFVNYLYIDLYGNFTNNGSLINRELELLSDVDQMITELNGNSFHPNYFTSSKPSGKTIMATAIDFIGCDVNMQNDTLIVPDNATLKFDASLFRNAVVYATPSMAGNLKLNMNGSSYIENCHVFNPEILNKVKAKNNHFYGDILVTDTLENDYYSYTVDIHGNIVNNGVIQNFVNYLYLNIEGDITNNGIWGNLTTQLTGTADQHLACTNSNKFSGYQFNNNNTTGDIYIDTFVHFDNVRVTFNNHDLYLPVDATLKINDAFLYLCNIVGSGQTSVVYGGSEGGGSPYFQNVTFNDLVLQGVNEFNSNCILRGTVVNEGSMQNDYYPHHLVIYDDFTNNGTIQDFVNVFYLDLYGNFINNGTLTAHELGLFSDSDQMLSEQNGNTYQVNYFTSYKPSGKTVMLTDVDFAGCGFNMDYDTLIVPDNGTLKFDAGYFKNSVVYATPSMSGNFILDMNDASYIQNCHLYNPEVQGTVKIDVGNNFYGDIIVTGILENNYYGSTLPLYGDVTNNGTIQNFVNTLSLELYGDFINNGILINSYFRLKSDTDQMLTELNGNSYHMASFASEKPSGKTIMLTDIDFVGCVFDMANDTLIVPDNGTLKFDAGSFNNTVVYAASLMNGDFKLDMNESSYIYNCHLFNPEILGTVKVKSNNVFYGNTVVTGILQNNYYGQTVSIQGNIINNGNVQNFVNYLTVNVDGDIQNNGAWTNSYTYLNGTTEQYIHLQDGHYITGQMRFISDIQVSPYQWIWDGWAIQNPPYPQPAIFSGETAGTLIFLNPVDNARTGTYYCSTGGSPSRNIVVDEIFSANLDLKVFLEGPFNGTDMNTGLNANGVIPLEQPYNPSKPYYNNDNPVWNYTGDESVVSIPANVVDWVIVQYRDSDIPGNASSATAVETQAAFVLDDGSVVGRDGNILLVGPGLITNNLFVVIFHRNHLGIMSASALTETAGTYTYDYTLPGQIYGGINGSKEIAPGVWGMAAGDGNGSGIIGSDDETAVWKLDLGSSGYLGGDFDMNGITQSTDETNYWKINLNVGGQVPGKSVAPLMSQVPK